MTCLDHVWQEMAGSLGCWAGAGLGIDFVKIVEKQNPILFFSTISQNHVWQEMAGSWPVGLVLASE